MVYINIFIELLFGYFALFLTVKVLGKTQISQITPFDFISALVLGDLLSSAVFDERSGLLKILFAILIWGALIYFTEMVTQKSRFFRNIFEGKPSLIINKGNIDWNEMKKNRLDIDQLKQLLRSKEVFSLQEVEFAVLENNGLMSVLRKSELDFPTCKDLNLKGENKSIPLTIISDGEVLVENLNEAGLNEDWLKGQLQAKGVKNPKEILYAEWKSGENLYFQKY
jgi:uncharacterized membrane protein YcaP (DUF421 family)